MVNPITYISPEAAPFLIQHGTADCVVPPGQSQLLFDALVPAIGADKVQLTSAARRAHTAAARSSGQRPTCSGSLISWIAS